MTEATADLKRSTSFLPTLLTGDTTLSSSSPCAPPSCSPSHPRRTSSISGGKSLIFGRGASSFSLVIVACGEPTEGERSEENTILQKVVC